MKKSQTEIVEQVKAKAAEIDKYLSELKPAGAAEARYLASAKRDIAGGFVWAQRAVSGDTQE